MSNEISFDAIDAAVLKRFYVEHPEENFNLIELDADYNDSNDFLLQTAYDHRNDAVNPPAEHANDAENAMLNALREEIYKSYSDSIFNLEDEILQEAGFDLNDENIDHARDYLYEGYVIQPPYDHFLDQTMRVNIMLKTPADADQEYGLIHDQFLAMARPEELSDSSPDAIKALLAEDSSLKRLIEQQGHTMDELANVLKAYMHDFYDPEGHPQQYRDENGKSLPYETRMDIFTAGRSKFLTSLCEELDNQTYSCGCITVLAEVSMKDFAKLMKPGSEITMPSDCNVGIFDPWNGAGSLLGIYLAKPLSFTREDIRDVQIEGAELDTGYSLDATYGMVGSAWSSPSAISEKESPRKPSLNEIIDSAKLRSESQNLSEPGRTDLSR